MDGWGHPYIPHIIFSVSPCLSWSSCRRHIDAVGTDGDCYCFFLINFDHLRNFNCFFNISVLGNLQLKKLFLLIQRLCFWFFQRRCQMTSFDIQQGRPEFRQIETCGINPTEHEKLRKLGYCVKVVGCQKKLSNTFFWNFEKALSNFENRKLSKKIWARGSLKNSWSFCIRWSNLMKKKCLLVYTTFMGLPCRTRLQQGEHSRNTVKMRKGCYVPPQNTSD